MSYFETRSRRHDAHAPLRFLAACLLLAALPWGAAQAIGDDVATFLDATGAIADGADGYSVGALDLATDAPNDVLASVRLSGSLAGEGLSDAASTLAIATGYGAGIEQPLLTFLRDRAPSFAGEGPVRISVESYVLELDIADAELTDVDLALSLPRVASDAFGPAVAVLGDPDAPVTIRVFSDFQCPFCARYALEILPGVEAGPVEEGEANFAFHHFPLTTIHANAVPAAEAAQCVVERFGDEAFWAYHDLVFERTAAWQNLGDPYLYFARLAEDVPAVVQAAASRDDVAADAAEEVAVDELGTCLSERATRDTVDAALEVARTLGLSGTPSVFVGGYRLDDFGNPQAYARLLRLAEAQAAVGASD